MTVNEIIAYQYAQTSANIYELKQKALKTELVKGYGYFASGASVGQKVRPSQSLIDTGWKYGATSFEKIKEHMHPKHELWKEYCWNRSLARMLCAAVLVSKGTPSKVSSQARTARQQTSLLRAAKSHIKKTESRLEKHPEKYAQVEVWIQERNNGIVARIAA